jgi:hypothetical protein
MVARRLGCAFGEGQDVVNRIGRRFGERQASPHRYQCATDLARATDSTERPPSSSEDLRPTVQGRWPEVADSPISYGPRVLARQRNADPHQASRIPFWRRTGSPPLSPAPSVPKWARSRLIRTVLGVRGAVCPIADRPRSLHEHPGWLNGRDRQCMPPRRAGGQPLHPI